MSADQSATLSDANCVPMATLALTTVEKQYAFSLNTTGQITRSVQLICDVDWLYSPVTGGPYVLIPAKTPQVVLMYRQSSPVNAFAKTVSGTGTLYAQTVG